MANSDFLRRNINQHSVKNSISKVMDGDVLVAVDMVMNDLAKCYPSLKFEYQPTKKLSEIVREVSERHPEMKGKFSEVLSTSFIKPDGGFIYAMDSKGNRKIILVAEVKRQGTNDKRIGEGLKKQSKGNAIERLGKNLIGIKFLFKDEKILPFICFGSGDDFAIGSSIRDRVITMNDFCPLNIIHFSKDFLPFEPVSLFFRAEQWTTGEMYENMLKIAKGAVRHYFGV